MQIEVFASQGDIEGVYIVRDFGDERQDTQFQDGRALIKVTLNDLARQYYNIVARWRDGTSSSFPIFLSSGFEGRTIQIQFEKATTGQPDASICLDERPSGVRDAFMNFFRCEQVAKSAEQKFGKWTRVHRRALSGWFRANYYLYTRATPSPYGLNTELVELLKEIDRDARPNIARDSGFAPLNVAEVRATLRLLEAEQIRLAGLVPRLVQNGALAEAKEINSMALDGYQKYQDAGGTGAVFGVNKRLLEANQKYINALSGDI
ncbi:hypothetical protein X749_31370 [Mesorhizobium sp. LNJC391B00]|nr:hypothetical protein X749_31370 [Mesorhizobium sp. LNJC391B00]